jgi:DNA-directed RNA polymerase specialized sigma24 family protein
LADGPGISDGDLVRLARDGDPVAFRLLVERYQPMVRARAAGLCTNASDVDDIMQEAFLRAFIAGPAAGAGPVRGLARPSERL